MHSPLLSQRDPEDKPAIDDDDEGAHSPLVGLELGLLLGMHEVLHSLELSHDDPDPFWALHAPSGLLDDTSQ